uniref:Uncharacterized protein LOC112821955 n=1 Tax=Callorhinus ursinus TaxID=34884 RepID=A0A3Q7NTT0_CALUR|nr:uncharacterized protein LOC112821955 [Callorhinus ursinus]
MWTCIDHFSVTPMFLHGKIEEHYLGDTPEMTCSPGFVSVVLLMLGQTHGDSVTQMEGQVTLSEETSLTMNCTFSTTWSFTVFWFVQYPEEGPQILLKASRDQEKKSNKGFEATLDSKSKSFHLKKGSVQVSDSTVYYCAMNDTVTGECPAPQVVQGTVVGVAVSMTLLETHGVPEDTASAHAFLTGYGKSGDGRASAPNQDLVEKEGKGRKEDEHMNPSKEKRGQGPLPCFLF